MTESLTYIEVDTPICSLTYGTLPCGARLPTADDPVAAEFGGSTYLKRGAGLTGAADSKLLTISAWVNIDDVNTGGFIFNAATSVNGTTQRTSTGFSAGASFFQGYNSAGTIILNVLGPAVASGRWVHLLASFDLSSTSKRHVYTDDVLSLNPLTYTNDTIDFTMADWGIGATPGGTGPFIGRLADVWIAPGVYIDFSVEANRRKFVTADRSPVDLGVSGQTPTGTAPLIFLSGDIASWNTNKGTGGGFTLVGTLPEGDFATGDIKCFDTIKTCQDRLRFAESTVTKRYAKSTEYLPHDIECLPFIDSVAFTPAIVSLGVDLGQRAALTVTFKDYPHSDTGIGDDKYLAGRDYDPFSQGTYWGKFRARQPFLRGRALRWITGVLGDALADMESRTFVIDSFTGPTPDGKFSITAKDVLKLADGDRSQAPVLSNGFLSADLTAVATSASLLPAGIGNDEYAAGGYLCIGGNEVVSFSRSADALTITRGQLGTTATTHKAQDRVQTVLYYAALDAAVILADLLVTYAAVPSGYIPVADWVAETEAFLGNVYTAIICEPTSVATLASELIEQAALSVWDDSEAKKVRLRVLRPVTTDAATFTPENTLQGTLQIKEQPEKRLSRVQVYFGQKDPTKPLSNMDNYRSSSLSIDEVAEEDYGSQAIKVILSRWIAEAGRTVADRLGAVQLGRYRDPPRRVQFQLMRYAETDAELGIGYRVEADCVQDATGAASNIAIQVTQLNPGADRFSIEGEEMLWTAPAADTGTRNVIFDANNFNINLRASHDSIYPAPQAGDVINCTVNSGVFIGSVSTALRAFDVGTWPAGVTINLTVNGTIQGTGGDAGYGGGSAVSGATGQPGGTALYTRQAINLTYAAGSIWAGGGGGGGGSNGGGGGGGGAGRNPGPGGLGSSAADGAAGTTTAGGAGGTGFAPPKGGHGGAGGGPGLAGAAGSAGFLGSGGAAGARGYAVDGISFVTVVGSPGDLRGGQIN